MGELGERKAIILPVGGRLIDIGQAEKEKAGLGRPAQATHGGTEYPRWKTEFFSTHRTGWDRLVGSVHYPNIEQRVRGVILQQVKGCGSVNRPTPGSRRPAEPVATGFLEGVKISKIRGQISGLGVKLGVVNAGFSQCRAILNGVAIGVAAISCCEQGKQSARLSAEHNWRG